MTKELFLERLNVVQESTGHAKKEIFATITNQGTITVYHLTNSTISNSPIIEEWKLEKNHNLDFEKVNSWNKEWRNIKVPTYYSTVFGF